ncbi:MAG: hypothetical protein ABIJ34_00695 [archaeon]
MYVCRKCNGYKIKTRRNVSFGKAISTPISCKTCNSVEIDIVDAKQMKYRKRRS